MKLLTDAANAIEEDSTRFVCDEHAKDSDYPMACHVCSQPATRIRRYHGLGETDAELRGITAPEY